MRTMMRVLAVGVVAVAVLAGALASSADGAVARHGHHAKHHHKHRHHHKTKHTPSPQPFVAPTLVGPVSAQCVETGDNQWRVSITWKVTGGRYAYLGSGEHPPASGLPPVVYTVTDGGTRYMTTDETWHGWPNADHSQPVTTRFLFQAVVAPIGKADDVTAWRSVEQYPTITFTCS